MHLNLWFQVIEQILQKIEAKRDKTFKAQLKTLTAQIKVNLISFG